MAVQDIIKAAANVISGGVQGLGAVYPDAPSALNQLPAVVLYPGDGDLDWPRKPNVRRQEHNLNLDLYVQQGGDIAAADRILKPYLDQFVDLFDQNIQLQGTCLTSGVVKYQYGKLEYAGTEYLGIKFTLKAVELAQVVYKA